ncbi:hypothetical protein Goshw_003597 [Gossypium schwendimanii]|uniref:Uncharacterized protein n=1 Tax=Gossypium schwendimanii TaxID=34291 RepID=A0A7J9KQC1_GOSSC|nr:hypothetical protein [Gossypium schwendimanii]
MILSVIRVHLTYSSMGKNKEKSMEMRVASVAVFVTRYIGMIRDAKEDLQHSTSYFHKPRPAWKYESMASNGQRIFSD